MCSVAQLTRSHEEAQRLHIDEALTAYESVIDFACPGDTDPREYARQRAVRREKRASQVQPYEGWVLPQWRALTDDPAMTQRASHDIIPRELVREMPGFEHAHSGFDLMCAGVSQSFRKRLDEYGLLKRARDPRQHLHENFTVRGDMHVHVVNIVHTSYCKTSDRDKKKDIIFPTAWLWRRLAPLGCQENHTYTSLKISFKPPFKASKLLFSSGRVLETGSANEAVSHVTFFDVMLEYMRLSGMPRLSVVERESQNVVAKSVIPGGEGLLLELLGRRSGHHVTYEPASFAGAVIRHPEHKKIMMLAFAAGSIVCVGPTDIPAMRAACDDFYDLLKNNVDTAANRQNLDRFRGLPRVKEVVTNHRGRKRARSTTDEAGVETQHRGTSYRQPKQPRVGGTHL